MDICDIPTHPRPRPLDPAHDPDVDPATELAAVGFTRLRPSPALDSIVSCYWGLTARIDHERVENLYPDGGWGVSFSYRDPFGRARPRACFEGLGTQRRDAALAGELDLFGVRFQPGAAHALVGAAWDDVGDQTLALRELGSGLRALAAAENLEGVDLATRAGFVEGQLLELLPPDGDGLLERARHAIRTSGGRIGIDELAASLPTSRRHLERIFRERAGLSPKTLARLTRIQRARLRLKLRPEESIVDVALECGFYDQAHLTREFGKVLGFTPGWYRKRIARRRRNEEEPRHAPGLLSQPSA